MSRKKTNSLISRTKAYIIICMIFHRDEKKKFKNLQREVEKMAALMKDEDDEDEDGETKEDVGTLYIVE